MELIRHFPQPVEFLENTLHVSFTIFLILPFNFTWSDLSLFQVTHKVSCFRIFSKINAPILRTFLVCKTKLNFVTLKKYIELFNLFNIMNNIKKTHKEQTMQEQTWFPNN
jgi:hypothetical protein